MQRRYSTHTYTTDRLLNKFYRKSVFDPTLSGDVESDYLWVDIERLEHHIHCEFLSASH